MEKELLSLPNMILIGSTGRNSGKTTLAIDLINVLKKDYNMTGLKVTTVQERDGKCPRGGKGCGVCSNIKGDFELIEETDQAGKKDTSCLLQAGADKVYWLKTFRPHIYEGIQEFLTLVFSDNLVICESNSLRHVVIPGMFIMLHKENVVIKQSAGEVLQKADIVIGDDLPGQIERIIEKVKLIAEKNGIRKKGFMYEEYNEKIKM